jgi:methionyl-tRNA formyltransferase
MTGKSYIIATDRPWTRDLVPALRKAYQGTWTLIGRQEDLNLARLTEIDPEYIFFPHWSQWISSEIYENFECIVFHMTDLPYGRGGSPLQNLIVRGHTETKISAIRCVAEIDAGSVYLKRPLSLHGSAEEIFLRSRDVIQEMIGEIISQSPKPQPQLGEPVIFRRRGEQDGDLSNARTLDEFYDYIRMLDADGYPPAFLDIGRFRLEFTRASRRHGRVVAEVCISEREENDDGS